MYEPMLAVEAEEPFDDPEWFFEPKWDGYRAIVERRHGRILIHGRHADLTTSFPELQKITLPEGSLLDGEIVAFRDGRPDFFALRQANREVRLLIFDILVWKGRTMLHEPLLIRRRCLEDLLLEPPLRLSAGVVGQGRRFFALLKELSFEGMMAKHLKSVYRPGYRSPSWLKFLITEERVVEVTQLDRTTHGSFVAHVVDGGVFRGRIPLGKLRIDPRLLTAVQVKEAGGTYIFDPPLHARVRLRGHTPSGQFRHATLVSFIP